MRKGEAEDKVWMEERWMTLGAEMLRTNGKVLRQVTLVAESEAGRYSAKHRPVSLEYLFLQHRVCH